MDKVRIEEKFAKLDRHWSPRIIARMNDIAVKAVKIEGPFIWHSHPDTDELFLVWTGVLTLRLRERDVTLHPGELFVVPRGVEHMPVADGECAMLLIEPMGTPNTGDAGGARTAPEDVWL
jgi:mannose-6-phosphate isomerase-like protein (cupin superfamily)